MIKKYKIEIALILLIGTFALLVSYKAVINGFGLFNRNLDMNFNSALGSLLSGTLGLIISTYTAILVYRTYNLQKHELDETKRLLFTQSYDQTFFNLLNSLRKSVEYMVFRDYIAAPLGSKTSSVTHEYKGVEAIRFFVKFYSQFFRQITKAAHTTGHSEISYYLFERVGDLSRAEIDDVVNQCRALSLEKQIQILYLTCYDSFQHILSSYCRTTYQILKQIDQLNTEGAFENAKRYSSIFQASLNSEEMTLLFYNGLCYPKAKKFLEKLGILENLYVESLIATDHSTLYETVRKSKNEHRNALLETK